MELLHIISITASTNAHVVEALGAWLAVIPITVFFLLVLSYMANKMQDDARHTPHLWIVANLLICFAMSANLLLSWGPHHDMLSKEGASEAALSAWAQATVSEMGWFYTAFLSFTACAIRPKYSNQLTLSVLTTVLYIISTLLFRNYLAAPSIIIRVVVVLFTAVGALIWSHSAETANRQHFKDVMSVEDAEQENKQSSEARIKAEVRADAECNLMAFLCHEIRNPFNGITGSLEEISIGLGKLGSSPECEELNAWAKTALTSSKYLIDILDNVLDQSKLEQGKLVLDARPINLDTLCQSVERMLRHTRNEGVEILVTVPTDLTVNGDATRWRQLLVNLMSNALKFTPDQGKVNLTVKPTPDNKLLCVEVCDDGPGISAELLPRLFEKYAQGGFHQGSGLGLSIAQLIVRLMGDDIKVESPYKRHTAGGGRGGDGWVQGSRFYFAVPLLAPKQGAVGSTASAVPGGGFGGAVRGAVGGNAGEAVGAGIPRAVEAAKKAAPFASIEALASSSAARDGLADRNNGGIGPWRKLAKLNVLVVEDDMLNCIVMQAKLKRAAQDVCEELHCEAVHSGEAAIEKYDEIKAGGSRESGFVGGDRYVDLVLMDEHMENGGGTLKGSETIQILRQHGCRSVVVACSGNCLPADRERYIQAGAAHVWPKPYPDMSAMSQDLLRWFGPNHIQDQGAIDIAVVDP
jgi:signal transduction histidine kinase